MKPAENLGILVDELIHNEHHVVATYEEAVKATMVITKMMNNMRKMMTDIKTMLMTTLMPISRMITRTMNKPMKMMAKKMAKIKNPDPENPHEFVDKCNIDDVHQLLTALLPIIAHSFSAVFTPVWRPRE